MRIWLGLLPVALALGQAPSFRAERVLPSGGDRPIPLAPGMLVSIYGEHLGPTSSCIANADTRRTETPNPARPWQAFAERLIYPDELCGVRVTLGGLAGGLLYVSETQINFKVPQNAPTDGEADLKVVHRDLSNEVKVRVGLDTLALSVEGEARVGGPVWIHVEMPYGWNSMVQYPVRIMPADFGCNEFEMRRNGAMLSRAELRLPSGGISFSGSMCGNISVDGGTLHTGRLPLHLQYRFTEPGTYEVRYTRHGDFGSPSKILVRSEWTSIRVLPALPRAIGPVPESPAELLSDYLPNVLAVADAAGLDAVILCLYHANETVRRFASNALVYWPEAQADARVDREFAVRGPSDVTIDGVLRRHPEMLPRVLPYLTSNKQEVLRAAILGVSRAHPDAKAETALIDAAEHVIRTGDTQTVIYYASALGTLRDPRAGTLLWDLVRRNIARDQASIAISWRKDPRDLPRLAALMESSELFSLPYALRNSYGDAAIPYLRDAMQKSQSARMRESCARELPH